MNIPMSHEEAWALNDKVENHIGQETASVSLSSVIPSDVLKQLKEFCVEYLQIPKEFNQKLFWYRQGMVHKQKLIQDFSKQYIEPHLNSNEVLIGDTAFCINHPPHDVHIDNRDFRADKDKTGIIGTTSVVVPIEIDTDDYPLLYTANQYFYGPSTRMRNGCEKIDTMDREVQRQIDCGVYFCYDYEKYNVKYLENEEVLDYNWWKTHIDEPFFVPHSTFSRLSIEAEHEWKPGNLIKFDSCRIHWAENLLKRSASYKIGLSLNYGIVFKELD